MDIIKRTFDEQRHVEFTIDHEQIHPLYLFCIENRFRDDVSSPQNATTDEGCLISLEESDEMN